MNTPVNEVVFKQADIPFLEGLAGRLGIKLNADRDTRLAQELYKNGAKVSGTESGHEPIEIFYMDQILEAVELRAELPPGFTPRLVVYLNDRGFAQLPENDVPTLLFRQTEQTRRQLFEAVHTLATSISKEK